MKKMLKPLFLLAMATSITFTACKKDDPKPDPNPDPTPATPYFKFAKVGNMSEYETSTPVLTQTYSGTMTQKVLRKIGSDIFEVETILSLGIPMIPDVTDTSYWKVSNTQFASVDNEQGSNPFPYFTQNDAVNKTYTITDSGNTYTRIVQSLNESVTVGAGTFSCFKVKETNTQNANESIYYFNKDSGMIRTKMSVVVSLLGVLNIDIKLVSKNF